MTSRVFRLWSACLGLVLAMSSQATLVAQDVQQPQELIDAERFVAAGDWDQTVVTLTPLIQRLESAPRDAVSARHLITAYEKRALARLQTGDRTNATIDFIALLQLEPNYAFAAPSTGIMNFFNDARKSALASVELTVRPNDAAVALEKTGSLGVTTAPLPTPVRIGAQWMTAGSYRMTIRKPGYETRVEEFELRPGMVHQLPIDLRRMSTVLFIRTVPAGVSVRVDGELRGTTQAAPDGGKRSEMLVIEGLVPRATAYRVRMEKDCFVASASELVVPAIESWKGPTAPDALWDPDRNYDTVELKPAFGTLDISADEPAATIVIDGERRGVAGKPITDVCQGDHAVEVRSPTGQFSQQVKVEFDKEVRVQARLIPTYGVVRTAGKNDPGAQADVPAVVQALRTANLRFVPIDLAEKDLALLASAAGEDLRRATDLLSQRLDTQGVATVTRVAADAEGRDIEMKMFARGSSKADVLRFSLQGSNVQRAVASLNLQIPLLRPTIGIDAVDVMRIEGAVVASVDPQGSSAGVIVPGDVIVGMGAGSIANVADLMAALEKTPDARVNIRLRDKPAPVSVLIQRRPDLVSVYDSQPFNVMITELNAQLARQRIRASSASEDEQRLTQSLRLNLGAALIAVGNCPAAQQTLSEVQLESRRGISRETVDYLRAVCYKRSGQVAEARALFEAASQAQDALLTEHGPAISYLARVELLTLGAAAQK